MGLELDMIYELILTYIIIMGQDFTWLEFSSNNVSSVQFYLALSSNKSEFCCLSFKIITDGESDHLTTIQPEPCERYLFKTKSINVR